MRILPVTESLLEVIFEEKLFIQPGLFPHVSSDHHVVLGRMRIGLG